MPSQAVTPKYCCATLAARALALHHPLPHLHGRADASHGVCDDSAQLLTLQWCEAALPAQMRSITYQHCRCC